MNEEQAKEMIKLMELSVDYMKSMHKELREMKVRLMEMNQ